MRETVHEESMSTVVKPKPAIGNTNKKAIYKMVETSSFTSQRTMQFSGAGC